jgi:hypothetical protein
LIALELRIRTLGSSSGNFPAKICGAKKFGEHFPAKICGVNVSGKNLWS